MSTSAVGLVRKSMTWIILLVGLVMSFLAHQVAVSFENRAIQSEQQRLTQMLTDFLQAELKVHVASLGSIRSFFLSSTHVSREEFQRFTEFQLKQQSSIQALEWIPRVAASERQAYRKMAIQDGFPEFLITERDAQGNLVPAGQRDEYFPVYYVEPYKGNEAALGFDLSSNERRRVSLELAEKTRQPQATASISLVQATARQRGFLVFQPIYSNDIDELTGESALMGFALGVFRIGDLFDAAISPVKDQLNALDVAIEDVTNPHGAETLIQKAGPALNETVWLQSRTLDFAGRSWRIETTATSDFIASHQSSTPWLVLMIGILTTLTIAAYTRRLIRDDLQVRELVRQRTAELESSAQLNNAIVENSVEAIITINDHGIISFFNPAAVEMFGYMPDEVIGKNVSMLMPEPYHSEHDGYLERHRQTGEKHIIGIGRQVSAQHKDGTIFPINLSVGKAMEAGRVVYVGTITNLTEITIKEQELRDFSGRLELATKAGGIGVWDYDIINNVLHWDDRMFELYGVSRDQFSGAYEAWTSVLHPDDLGRAQEEFAEAISGGKPFQTEFRIRWPDGQKRHIQAFAEVIKDENDTISRIIGVNQDITQRKLAEQAMRDAIQAAEEASQQKSAFLNTMSHEFRTPLTVMLGYLPILKNADKLPSPDIIHQIAEDMDLSGQHLLSMINDLLDISKIEAGQMPLKITEIQAQPLVSEMIRKFKNQCESKGIELATDVEDFKFMADERRLRGILINLVGNALKFTDHGSITLSASRENDFMRFSVSDTGIGISSEDLPHIFDTFRQADNTSTRKTGGSGLGLAITRKLVELHGGSIHADSKPGEGSTFTFTLKQ